MLQPFETLTKKLIYGGYIRVRNEYAIFITTVEFYYHEEDGMIKDPIVYHRNAMFEVQEKNQEPRMIEVPYFPIMTFNAHQSGIDITFENEELKYRASALIREYVVYDINEGKFIELDTRNKESKPKSFVGVIIRNDEPKIDDRSSFLYYFLNAFSINGYEPNIQWVDISSADYGKVTKVKRLRANDHDWAYKCADELDYISKIVQNMALKQ